MGRGIGLALALVGVGLLTALMVPFRASLGLQNAVLLYLLWVLGVATLGGRVPALGSAVASFLALNWWFTPPLHEIGVRHARDVVTLGAFVAVAGVVSALVDLAARQRDEARHAQLEAASLTRMAGLMLREADPLPQIAATLATAFDLDGVTVFGRRGARGWIAETTAGPRPPRSPLEADRSLPLGEKTLLAWRGAHLRPEAHDILDSFATQLALAVQGRRLAAEASTATGLAKANELRNALLAAVSHDLRTPLASIRTAATTLLAQDVTMDEAAVRDLLETIDVEAERLDTLVANLLAMSRLQAGHLGVELQAVGIDEVVGRALLGLHLPAERVHLVIPEALPSMHTDPALLERAVANLLDNADHHAPKDRPIQVRASSDGAGQLVIEVADHGPGIPAAARAQVLEPFERLEAGASSTGVGLGLAVAHGFVEAIGGSLSIGDTPGGGTTVAISLPAEEPA